MRTVTRNIVLWALSAGLSSAPLAACGKSSAPPGPAATPPAAATKAPEPAAATKAPEPAAATKAPEPAAATKAPEPAAATKAPEPAPQAAPAEFTAFGGATLADIPDKPLHGKVLGKAFADPKVAITYSSSDWSIEVRFSEDELFSIRLSDKLEAPAAGYTWERPRGFGYGYVHRREVGGDKPISMNAEHTVAIAITRWDVAAYAPDGGVQQPGGKVAGKLAVVYDQDTWVAGTFELDFTWFGEPPLVRAANEAKAKEAALADVKVWAGRPGAAVAAGAEVLAAYREGDAWRLGLAKVEAVADGVVTLGNGGVTAPVLVRALTPHAGPKVGDVVAAHDHLGLQLARVLEAGPAGSAVKVSYLGPSGKPRDNELKPERVFAWATTPGGDGAPAFVFVTIDGERSGGRALAAADGKVIVLREDGKAIVEVPEADVTLVPVGGKPLAKGAAVEAYFGCAMVPWKTRAAKVEAVLGDGVGYDVKGDDCVQTVQADRVMRAR